MNLLKEALMVSTDFYIETEKHEARILDILKLLWRALHEAEDAEQRQEIMLIFKNNLVCLYKIKRPLVDKINFFARYSEEPLTEDILALFAKSLDLPEDIFLIGNKTYS